jgi:plastocyanin
MKNKSIICLLLLTLVTTLMATTRTVIMQYPSFTPETLHAFVGDTVRWKNQDTRQHTTTSGTNGTPNGIWNSGTMNSGDSFKFRFGTQGNYPYFCAFHYTMGMVGLVIVNPVDIEENVQSSENSLTLENYPNPFKLYATIKYEVKVPGNVNLMIFDATGKLINQLINKYQLPGKYLANWDGRMSDGHIVQNGIYFYKLVHNNKSIIGKILKV